MKFEDCSENPVMLSTTTYDVKSVTDSVFNGLKIIFEIVEE